MTKDDRYGAAGDTYGDELLKQSTNGSASTDADTADTADGSSAESGSPSDSAGGDESPAEPESSDGAADAGRDGLAELPFIFARRTVKADRDALPVYVREATAGSIDELERDLDARFDGDDVMSLDVREAVVKAGLRNVDDVVDVMEEWGYGRR